ncbi:hypothetical protein P3T36_002255 [Kitasatospora sp. MAP12-15]|nr:hypothetical protein [Kitasatospora sp. MAP12-44]
MRAPAPPPPRAPRSRGAPNGHQLPLAASPVDQAVPVTTGYDWRSEAAAVIDPVEQTP